MNGLFGKTLNLKMHPEFLVKEISTQQKWPEFKTKLWSTTKKITNYKVRLLIVFLCCLIATYWYILVLKCWIFVRLNCELLFIVIILEVENFVSKKTQFKASTRNSERCYFPFS